MTDDVTITLFLAILAIIVISWAWYMYTVRREEILRKAFAEDKRKTDFFDVPIAKRKPRTQVKKPVAKKAAIKKPVAKKTTTKGIK
jgi:hypothetical protein